MSVDRALEGWEGVQRQGHDIAERFTSLAQGLGCMLQSYVTSSVNPTQPSDQPATPYPAQQDMDGQYNDQSGFHWPWNWTSKPRKAQARSNRVQFNGNRRSSGSGSVSVDRGTAEERTQSERVSTGIHELGQRLGQAGADLGACLCDIVRYAVRQFHRPFQGDTEALPRQTAAKPSSSVTMDFHGGFMEWREVDESRTTEGKDRVSIGGGWKGYNHSSRHRKAEEVPQSQQDPNEFQDVSNEELFAYLTKSHGQFHKQQGSVSVTTTFDSRTQELESSVVARGDLWRAEASHGGNSSANGSSPLFLLQIGPILFVRDTTLLLPVHLSKQHLLWYGFDRKNGLHSLCPAVWSKHRRWLFMSMICLNPFTCSFMDLQFPNGQFTYVAGEGVTTSAFFHAFGGLLQVHSRQPGDTKLSFSHKTKWGTRLTPSVQLPEKSYSIGIAQPLAWQRSGLMVRPTIQLSVTPTFGGRNAGWRAELIHSPKEKLSWACGCAVTIQPSAFASISLGRSKHNGGHSGCSGLVLQVETPLESINRASFSIQLNSGVEF